MAELNFSLEKVYWKEEVPVDITPTTEPQTVTPEAGHAFNKVNVSAIPAPVLQDKVVTPTKQTQNIRADAGFDGLDEVQVNPIPPEYVVPSGTKLITENVTGEDVTNYAAVDVAVPGPSGTKQISITANGTTTEDVTNYADVKITVNTLPAKGLVFEDYDSDGYPHSARFVGTWTELPISFFAFVWNYNSFAKYIKTITLPDSITIIRESSLRNNTYLEEVVFPHNDIIIESGCTYLSSGLLRMYFYGDVTFPHNTSENLMRCANLKTVIFDGNVNEITRKCFNQNTATELYDFSHCTAIPPLYSTDSIQYKSGCVIRIPAALSDTTLGTGNGWESATNWSALTDIVWEVV